MSDSDLEAFRAETRAWLEANCPPEMREPVRDEDDIYWGGRNATFKSDGQKAWFEACRDKGYTVAQSKRRFLAICWKMTRQLVQFLRIHDRLKAEYRDGYNRLTTAEYWQTKTAPAKTAPAAPETP